tara:strand:+ start:3345 stop:3737 length:393 start_codon:yes stop_codon:yes gene_type:complete
MKKDYNSIPFKNQAIDKLTNGGGKSTGPFTSTSLYKESYKKDKGGERSRVRTQTNVTYLDSGNVFHEKYRSRTGVSGNQRERTVTYSLPSEGQGYKIVTKPSGKTKERTLSEKRTQRLRNRFYGGRTINR